MNQCPFLSVAVRDVLAHLVAILEAVNLVLEGSGLGVPLNEAQAVGVLFDFIASSENTLIILIKNIFHLIIELDLSGCDPRLFILDSLFNAAECVQDVVAFIDFFVVS